MPDFSCYITVTNDSKFDCSHVSDNIIDGHFATNPPGLIRSGETVRWQLQDNVGPVGSEAYTVYAAKTPTSSIPISLHYSCPVWSANIFTCQSSNPLVISARNTSNGGHPLNATSVWSGSMFQSDGLAGVVPKEVSDALEADLNDKEAWKKAEEHLTAMKNADRWTVG